MACGPRCRPLPPPPPYRCKDLAFALVGTLAFLADVAADLGVAVSHLQAGHYHWGGLMLGFVALSSLTTQLFSWAWYQSDLKSEISSGQPRRPLSVALHVLQLGYLYRCLYVLKVGIDVCQLKATAEHQQAFAIFLSHDVSLLRLFETFLESAPQLTLGIYVILQTSKAEIFQVVGICTSFFSITWAILDYQQALRSFLRDKHKLAFPSSLLYFLWNLLMVCPRILSVALFAVLFPRYIVLHFLGIWLTMFLWVSFQGTDLMEHVAFEWLYRAAVAVILYFCWFNVAEGKTCHRSALYHVFLLLDSTILAVSWLWYNAPFSWDSQVGWTLPAAVVSFVLGILLKCVYYWHFHPALQTAFLGSYDEVDRGELGRDDTVASQQLVQRQIGNHRMYKLSQQFFAVSSAEMQLQGNGTVMEGYL